MKSFDLAEFPVEKTTSLLTDYLDRLIFEADAFRPGYSSFHAQTVPSIDLDNYLARIQKYCPASNECYLAIIVYLHRLMRHNHAKDNPITIDVYSVHRLVIAGIMISSKFFSDVFYTNSRYAKVGGIYVSELNMLEVDLLVALDFNLSISLDELQFYGDSLLNKQLPLTIPTDLECSSASTATSLDASTCGSSKGSSLYMDSLPSQVSWSLTSRTMSPVSHPATPTAAFSPGTTPHHHSKLSSTSASLFPKCTPSSHSVSSYSHQYDHLY